MGGYFFVAMVVAYHRLGHGGPAGGIGLLIRHL